MSLTSYKDWRAKIDEASPMTRLRAGLGVQYPMTASIMSRSTPSPQVMKKAEEELGTPEKPKRKRRSHKRKKKS
jgi:hypothetical protein